MSLSQYLGKRVKIIDVDDDVFEGKCISFTPAADNDPEVESIDIETESGAGHTVGFDQADIKNIEVIE